MHLNLPLRRTLAATFVAAIGAQIGRRVTSISANLIRRALLAAGVGIAFSATGLAQTAVSWNSNSAGNWNASSWTGNGTTTSAPANNLTSHYAYFNRATGVTITTQTTTNVAGIEFGASAGAYTLSNTGGGTRTITIGAYGIRNSSANNQVITGANSRITLGAASVFRVDGAGSLTISTTGGTIATTGTNTLTLRGTGAGGGTINSQLTGAGTITKLDSGTWTLGNASNDYSGGTIIGSSGGATGGTLAMSASDVLGTGAITIYAGTLSMGANNETITGGLNLGGGAASTTASITGTGTLTIGGNVTYSATNGPLGASIGANLNLGSANRTFNIGNSGNATLDLSVSGAIGGTGGILKTGDGTLMLGNATSTYTGNTTISQGTIQVNANAPRGANGALGNTTTAVVINDASTSTSNTALLIGAANVTVGRDISVTNNGSGTVSIGATGSVTGAAFTGNIALAKATTFTADTGSSVTFGTGVISGAGNVTKSGAGTVILSGTNTYTGNTIISQGTLQIDSAAPSGASGALGNSTTTVTINDANTGTNATSLIIGTTGVVVGRNINVANQGTGNVTIGGSGSTSVTEFSGNISVNRAITLQGGSLYTAFSGSLSGTGNITVTAATGSGNVYLFSNNSGYSGAINVATGGLLVGNANALGTGNVTVAGGAGVYFRNAGTITSSPNISLAGNALLNNQLGNNTYYGNITLTGNATISGVAATTMTLGNVSPGFSPSGDTEPSESAFLTIGNTTLTFSGAGNIIVNSRIRDFAGQTSRISYDNPPLTLVSSPSTASPGNVIVDMGSSTAYVHYLANANSYTGSTTVANGTLILDTVSNAGAPHDPVNASFHAINGSLIIGDGNTTYTATVRLGSGASANEVISALSTVEIKKDGILNINTQSQSLGALTFTGGGNITMSGSGTLYLSQDVIVNAALGTPAQITGGQLSLRINRDVNVDADTATRTFTINGGVGNAYDMLISSTIQKGDLVKAGNGTLKLTGNNDYLGYTQVTNGILLAAAGSDTSYRSALGGANSGDDQGTYVNVNAGTLTGNASMSGTLQLMGNIAIEREKLHIYGTGFGNIGALNNLTGNNTWGNITESNTLINLAGNSTISSTAGTLTIATNIGSSSNNALTFDTASGSTITVSGGINTTTGNATTATVTKTGLGTLVLAGNSNYKGLTDIQSGRVIVTNNGGLGSSDGATQLTAQAELQLSNVTISAEALTLNGYGYGNVTAVTGTGALHNIAGNSTFGGTISLASDSSIKTDSGTSLTLGAIQNSNSTHRALTMGGVGNTTINGAVSIGNVTTGNFTYVGSSGNVTTTTISSTGSGGTLTKIDSGLLTFGGGATSAIDTFTVSTGNVAINSGTTVRTGVFTSAGNTTTTINGTLQSYYGAGNTTISGKLAGSGLFQKDGAGTLTFNGNSFNASSLDLTLTGGALQFLSSNITLDDLTLAGGALSIVNSTINVDTLTLAGGTLNFATSGNLTANTIYITANTTIDFGGVGGTFLSSANLVIAGNVTVTVNNWVSVANQANQSTVWYLRNAGNTTGGVLNPGNITLTSANLYGGTPLSQIVFTGYGGMTTTWVSTAGTGNGWHQNEIRPTPEPATYGAIFVSCCLGFVGWRRFRRRQQ